jgi:hypothetical protein
MHMQAMLPVPLLLLLLLLQVWENPEAFMPERFPLDQPMPNEQNTDYR